MCGIAGIIGLDTDRSSIDNMLKSMYRRGPDASGWVDVEGGILLHSRLAIIDPQGGAQPMSLDWNGQRYSIVYNGELYNTEHIRKLLLRSGHCFLGHSDTEVLLHAYVQWGKECLDKLNGIYSFGVWEHKNRRLFLARDRMGVKPLFYTLHNGGLIFASEMKTIFQYPTFQPQLDSLGISQIIMLGPGRIPGSGVLKNIMELEPGCYGEFCDNHWRSHRYWRLTDGEHRANFEETSEEVRYLVKDAIVRQMVSDVPVGTFLSGGLDSSLISSICGRHMKENGEKLHTFSVDYENNAQFFVPGKFQPESDNQYIDIMTKDIGSEHHWTVLSADALEQSLAEAVIARDLPGMADVDGSLLAFCKDVRKYVKVALSGECADEIFGGYPWYRDPEVRSVQGFPWAQNTNQRAAILHRRFSDRKKYEDFVSDHYGNTIRESDILPGTTARERRMKEMVNLNYRWFMQTLLDRKDRMSMYSGLEVRVPFCDYRIAQFMYRVPWEFKDYMGKEKGLLRYAMTGYLPEQVLWRKKSPYPKTYDPRYEELVTTRLKDLLNQTDAPVFQLLDRQAVTDVLAGEEKWPWYGQLMKKPQTIAYILMINMWLIHNKISIVE